MERSALRNPLRLTLALVSLVLLTGCGTIPPYALIARDSLCKSWRHKTLSKAEIDALARVPNADLPSQIEGDNKARPEWGCRYGKNEAAS